MKNSILLAAVFCLQALFAQRLSHPLRAASEYRASARTVAAFPETVKVLTILVQFQQDNDSRTSGNGQFDLSASSERIIDAPPHDSSYVADHFAFAQKYFSKASNGKQHVKTTVLGKVITLKKQMKEYAPVSGNLPIGNMIEEAWKAADSLYPGFPFSAYGMFAIVHAGVGKDIDLRAALGYDPTPLDIPSLYFSLSSLKTLFGNTYQGVTLKNSSFTITNTVVLPETEVRRIPGIGGDIVLKLGINGLLVASIGSYLGLPDLFDTKTGKSGIGRFGLMDGQSIFSFLGVSPPEPNAWEKIYLGWTVPIEVYGNKSLRIPAVGMYAAGNDTIYKIPISAKEYYLVETRHRDVKGDGQTVTMKWQGQIVQQNFLQDQNYFSNTSIDSVYGVILDVDELDWSLPGLINANNTYKGGVLIWHIDESIIEKTIGTNSVNADPARRGVDLEEADGSQDIGQTYDFGDPASGSEDGSPIDYWFSGNIFPSYKNEFSERTNPNTLSNSLARSHVTFKNFSAQSPVMTVDASVGSADIQLVRTVKQSSVAKDHQNRTIISDVNNDGSPEWIIYDGSAISILRENGTPFTVLPNGKFYSAQFPPVIIDNMFGDGKKYLAAVSNGYALLTIDSLASGTGTVIAADTTITTPIFSINKKVFVGTASGRLEKFSPPASRTLFKPFNSSVLAIALLPDENWVAANKDSIKNSLGKNYYLSGKTVSEMTNIRINSGGDISTVVKTTDNVFIILDAKSLELQFQFSTGLTGNSVTAYADVDNDGSMDFIMGKGNTLRVYNNRGNMVESFPFTTLDGGEIIGSPVVVGVSGSTQKAIVFGTSFGHLYAISASAKILSGFPLQTGGIRSSVSIGGKYLSAASSDSSVYLYNVGSLFDTSKIFWNGSLATRSFSNYVENTAGPVQKSSELLPKKFAYNWPNPVYSGSTYIRYYLGKAASVNIKIVNQAGELVEELKGTGYAGLDNEVPWNISGIQSGIYFAQITATGSGESASQIVKIAVVK